MAMTKKDFRALLRSLYRDQVHIGVFVTLAWLLLFALPLEEFGVSLGLATLFSVFTACATITLLRFWGFFDRLAVIPRLTQLITLLAVVPLGVTVSYAAWELMIPSALCTGTFCALPTLLLYSPLAALLVYQSDRSLGMFLIHHGYRRRVVLDLLPAERDSLLADFVESGIGREITCCLMQEFERVDCAGEQSQADLVVISRDATRVFDNRALLIRAHLQGVRVLDAQTVSRMLTGRIKLPDTDQWGFLSQAIPQTPALRAFRVIKRVADPLMALLLLVLLAPLALLIAALIRWTSKGPILYRQRRLGYLGRPFTLLKFRTMVEDAEASGAQWSSGADDPRVTRLGRFLRRTRLDEFPQLVNIIRGELSFVGPRPERPEIYESLKQHIPNFSLRTVVRPGITGWAQVKAGYAASVEESHIKLEYDLYYIQSMSPSLDLRILIRTVVVGLFGDARPPRRSEREYLALRAPLLASTEGGYGE